MVPTWTILGLAGTLSSSVMAISGSGHTTRYWDCCKTSCAWEGKASVSEPVLTCDKQDNPVVDANARSGCDGGGAFACTNNSPWTVNDNLAYGFAATALTGGTEGSWCCACYAITFTSGPVAGKKMVVQSTNTGGDLSNNHFDLMIPGGGLGIFDGCSAQFGQLLPGERYGGVSSRSQCDQMPDLLKDGCQWRFDWFKNADNPDIEFEQVQCPKELVAVSGCVRDDDSSFPVFEGSGSGTQPTKPATSSQPTTTVATSTPSNPSPPQQPEDTEVPAVTAPTSSPAVSVPSSGARVSLWGQCDSEASWDAPLKCAKGTKCVYINDWYSQCQLKNSCA